MSAVTKDELDLVYISIVGEEGRMLAALILGQDTRIHLALNLLVALHAAWLADDLHITPCSAGQHAQRLQGQSCLVHCIEATLPSQCRPGSHPLTSKGSQITHADCFAQKLFQSCESI